MSAEIPSLKERAQAIASRGIHVFPLEPKGKRPATTHGYKDATTDPQQIGDWWEANPSANIGAASGAVSGFFVLDIDGDEGEASLRRLEAEHEELPLTVTVLTGGGGRHLYFLYPGQLVPNSAGKLGEGLDIRGDGGYVVVPPSVHASGCEYIRCVDSPDKMTVAPPWLLSMVTGKRSQSTAPNGQGQPWLHDLLAEGVGEGSRNDTMARIAGKLLRSISEPFLVLELCRCVNSARFNPPLSDLEVKRTVNSIAKAELQNQGVSA